MKDSFLTEITHHPIWSKVIATAIVAIGGLLLSWIASLFGKKSFGEILTLDVPLFFVVILILVAVFVTIAVKDANKEKLPKFLKITEMTIGAYTWTWSWEQDEKNGKYYLGELHLLCPQCRCVMYCGLYEDFYHCINGHSIYARQVEYSVSYEQIQHNILTNFPDEKGKLELR